MGRRAGGRNQGFFYRAGRGWFAKIDGRFVPLVNEAGERLPDKNTPKAVLKSAFRRASAEPTEPAEEQFSEGITVLEVCTAYLAQVESSGAQGTFENRQRALFDFCFGLPSRFIAKPGKETPKPTTKDYIHKGYGGLQVGKLLPIHIDRWLQAHRGWKGARRTKIQAVKRALNYGVESGLIATNPIKGYKTPKQNGRATYLTPEQEAALIGAANPALAIAIKVCVRTGARPSCEFAKLTAAHVRDNGNRMEWVFKSDESKTNTLRTIRINAGRRRRQGCRAFPDLPFVDQVQAPLGRTYQLAHSRHEHNSAGRRRMVPGVLQGHRLIHAAARVLASIGEPTPLFRRFPKERRGIRLEP